MEYLKSNEPLLIVIGPSGSGKSSAIHELCAKNIIEVTPSWTTRQPRFDEAKIAIEHRFVSEQDFEISKRSGHFLEVVELFGLPYRYALPKVEASKSGYVPLIMLRASLLPSVSKYYSNYRVYHIEDTYDRIERRLLERQAKGEFQGSRLLDYEHEVELGRAVADRVFVNSSNLETIVGNLRHAIAEDFPK